MRLALGLALLALLALGALLAPYADTLLGQDPFTPDLFNRHAASSASTSGNVAEYRSAAALSPLN